MGTPDLRHLVLACGMCAGTSQRSVLTLRHLTSPYSAHRHYKGPGSNYDDRAASQVDEKIEVA